jgi:predicted Fe-Mo cluster-binding NifX family protein
MSDLPTNISKPAQRALAGAGIKSLAQLAKHSEAEVLKLHGMGPKACATLKEALRVNGKSFMKKQKP